MVLIILTSAYPYLRKIKLSYSSLLIIAVLTVISYIPLTYSPILCRVRNCLEIPVLYLFYMFFGIFLARNYEEVKTALHPINSHLRFLLLAASPLLIVIEEAFLGDGDSSGKKVYFRISTLLATYVIVTFSISFESLLEEPKVSRRCISFLSEWSLGIFCLNPLLIETINKLNLSIFRQQSNYSLELSLSFLFTILIILAAILASFFIRHLGGKPLVK